MNLKRQSTSFWLSRIAVLLIYIPFFAVQCFFNYSGIAQGKADIFQTHCEKQISKGPTSIADCQKNAPVKAVGLNLNKRFQPGSICTLFNATFEAPLYFFQTDDFSSYISSLVPSSLLYTGALRGPPVVA